MRAAEVLPQHCEMFYIKKRPNMHKADGSATGRSGPRCRYVGLQVPDARGK